MGWSAGRFPDWSGVRYQSIGLVEQVLVELVVGSVHGVLTIA